MSQKYCMHCMQPLQNGETVCRMCGYTLTPPVPAHHLKCGTILRDKYLIGNALGDGGFGITYIGRDLTLDMRIAVKEYYPNGCANRSNVISNEVTMTHGSHEVDYEKDMNRFLSEARILARFCNEPGVVGVRDFFRENGTAYIVMEYLDGITLKDYITTYGSIPAKTFFCMIDPMLQVLGNIHKQGLIHRDISPDNIMMLKNGKLKLLDFGAAREVTGDKSLSVVLKPGYAPEEQYRSKGKQGPWTDVYAMCATIYKCITGVTPEDAIQRAFEDNLKSPSELGVAITAEQEMAILQGLSVKSGDRIQSMDDLRNALAAHETENIRSIQIHRTEKEVPLMFPDSGERTEHQSKAEQTVHAHGAETMAEAEGSLTAKQDRRNAIPNDYTSTIGISRDATVKIPAEDSDATVEVSQEADKRKSVKIGDKDIENKAVDAVRDLSLAAKIPPVVQSGKNGRCVQNGQMVNNQQNEQDGKKKKDVIVWAAVGILAVIGAVLLLIPRNERSNGQQEAESAGYSVASEQGISESDAHGTGELESPTESQGGEERICEEISTMVGSYSFKAVQMVGDSVFFMEDRVDSSTGFAKGISIYEVNRNVMESKKEVLYLDFDTGTMKSFIVLGDVIVINYDHGIQCLQLLFDRRTNCQHRIDAGEVELSYFEDGTFWGTSHEVVGNGVYLAGFVKLQLGGEKEIVDTDRCYYYISGASEGELYYYKEDNSSISGIYAINIYTNEIRIVNNEMLTYDAAKMGDDAMYYRAYNGESWNLYSCDLSGSSSKLIESCVDSCTTCGNYVFYSDDSGQLYRYDTLTQNVQCVTNIGVSGWHEYKFMNLNDEAIAYYDGEYSIWYLSGDLQVSVELSALAETN